LQSIGEVTARQLVLNPQRSRQKDEHLCATALGELRNSESANTRWCMEQILRAAGSVRLYLAAM
jgi:hypothetical protein